MTETQLDTKKKIIEAASFLFGVKGFDGTSTREIGRRAGVNISSLNYHFRSKQNLMEEVAFYACEEFKIKLKNIAANPDLQTTSDYVLSLYSIFLDDGYKCLNEFKLFLDAKNFPDLGDSPIGLVEITPFLKRELNPKVPEIEYQWVNNVLFSYIFHTAIVSMSVVGKQYIDKFLPDKQNTNREYIKRLTESLIRDLNFRYQ